MTTLKTLSVATLMLAATVGFGTDAPPEPELRAVWFKEAKFGMFIHWGLYAQAGGVWKGQKYWLFREVCS